jgi:hypothetical protein
MATRIVVAKVLNGYEDNRDPASTVRPAQGQPLEYGPKMLADEGGKHQIFDGKVVSEGCGCGVE